MEFCVNFHCPLEPSSQPHVGATLCAFEEQRWCAFSTARPDGPGLPLPINEHHCEPETVPMLGIQR